MVTQVEIKNIADKIAAIYDPEKIFLFGSFAWGKPTESSDVDLLVIKDTENTRSLAMKIDNSLFPRQFPIDVIVYTPEQLQQEIDVEDPFALKITNKGKVLFSAKR